MCKGKRIIAVAGLATAVLLSAMIFGTVLPCSALAAPQAAVSPKVHQLATQLAEEWLKEQGLTTPAAASPPQVGNSVADDVNSDFDAIHDQIVALADAVPDLPHEFERAA